MSGLNPDGLGRSFSSLTLEDLTVNGTATGVGGGGAAGVRYASDFSGANGEEQIQAAADDLPASGGKLVIGPDGPDDDITDAADVYPSFANTWKFDETVTGIPSNTSIIINNTTLIKQDNASTQEFFRNSKAGDGTSDRNENIAIIGHGNARLHGNSANLDESVMNTPVEQGLHPHKIDGFTLKNLIIGPTLEFALAFEDVTDFYVENIRFNQDGRTDAGGNNTFQDGFHCIGPNGPGIVNGLYGETHDDFTSFTPAGNASLRYGSEGDIEDIQLSNLTARPYGNANPIKIDLTGSSAVRNLSFDGLRVVGSGNNDGVLKADQGPIENLSFTNIVTTDQRRGFFNFNADVDGFVATSLQTDVGNVLFSVAGATATNVRIGDVDFFGVGGPPAFIKTGNGAVIEQSSFHDISISSDTNNFTDGVGIGGTDTLRDVQFTNMSFTDMAAAGYRFNSSATVENVSISNPTFRNVDRPLDDENDNGTLGVTSGVSIDQGTETMGSAPTASNHGTSDAGLQIVDTTNTALYVVDIDGNLQGPL
jgi:hypothetical protein